MKNTLKAGTIAARARFSRGKKQGVLGVAERGLIGCELLLAWEKG
jgi:hypothetical protein